MSLIIDGINFNELEAEKYWSFPKSYKKDSKKETQEMVISGDYIGARKVDGAYYRFIKDNDGDMWLQGRSRGVGGSFLNKLDHVPQLMPFFNNLPNGTCLLGEIYFPKNEGSSNVTTIMGCLTEKALSRQQKGEKLHYYIFDIWAFNGKSMLNTIIEKRIELLDELWLDYLGEKSMQFIEFANYLEGATLWNRLGFIFLNNGEGIVITKKGTVPSPGKRTARKTLKIKKEINNTIDCFFTGTAFPPTRHYSGTEIENWEYWEETDTGNKVRGKFFFKEEGKYIPITKPYFFDWCGSLEIGVYDNNHNIKSIGALSGLTDEIKGNYKNYINKPIEVTAMEVLPTGGLRHAKFVKFREDLTLEDCTLEKFMEVN